MKNLTTASSMSSKKDQHTNSKTSAEITPHSIKAMQFKGPVPDPETLQEYENICPGFANRLITMAEKEQDARHASETSIILNQEIQHQRDSNTYRQGQTYAMLSVLFIVGLCSYIAFVGGIEEAAWVAGVVIVSLAGVFITKKVVFPKLFGKGLPVTETTVAEKN